MSENRLTEGEIEVLDQARSILEGHGMWLHYEDGSPSQSCSQVAQRLGLIIEAERRRSDGT